ncbi:ATP synthase F0 subunit B [bacterium]|nr:ATP synthase F0 subunit B [bacterium]
MSSIEFQSSTAIWTVVNFVILLGLVHKFALPSLYKMVDESEEKRESLLRELEGKVQESDRLIAEYKEKLASAQQEARDIVARAHKEAEELKRYETQKLTESKQQILSGVQSEISSEKARVIGDVKGHAAALIVAATTKILGKEISAEAHQDLIRHNIQQFESVVSHERQR